MVREYMPKLGVIPRRVALEVRPREVLFAESSWRPGGPRLHACGRVPCEDGEKPDGLLKRLMQTSWLRNAEISLAIRHPDMNLQRLDLPPLSDRDARRVANRRAEELARESPEATSWACVISHGKGPRAAWLITCPEEFAEFAQKRWEKQGLDVSHFGMSQLALGSMTRAMPEQDVGALRAFLDISNDHAVCVLADREGWVFGREIPIKIAGATRSREGDDSAQRLATELNRTFHYVDVECQAGAVTTLVLSGTRKKLDELATQLAEHLDLDVKLLGDTILDGPAAGADAALATVIGLVLEPRLGGANLLPAHTRREIVRARSTRLLAFAAIVSAIILTLGMGRTTWLLSALEARGAMLEREWEERSDDRERTESNVEARAFAEAVVEAREIVSPAQPAWSTALRSLGFLLPADSFVSAFAVAQREGDWLAEMQVEFRGSDLANVTQAGSDFARSLDRSPLFRVQRVERAQAPRIQTSLSNQASVVRAQYRVEALLAPLRRQEVAAAAARSAPEPQEAPRRG